MAILQSKFASRGTVMRKATASTRQHGPHLTMLVGAHVTATLDIDGRHHPLLFSGRPTLHADAFVVGDRAFIATAASAGTEEAEALIVTEPLLRLGARGLDESE